MAPLISFNAAMYVKFQSIKAESLQVKPFSRPAGGNISPRCNQKGATKKNFPGLTQYALTAIMPQLLLAVNSKQSYNESKIIWSPA